MRPGPEAKQTRPRATVVVEVRSNFFFALGRFFFWACVALISCQERMGTSTLPEIILFIFFSFLSPANDWKSAEESIPSRAQHC